MSGEGSNGSKHSKRYERDNQDNTKEKAQWKGIHAQTRRHMAGNFMSKLQRNHSKVAYHAAQVSTKTTSTSSTLIDNHWMEGSYNG